MQVKRMNKGNRNKHYINYFAALLLFGSNGLVAEKISMDSYGIVFWRVAVGLAAILIILFIKRRQDQKEQKAAVSPIIIYQEQHRASAGCFSSKRTAVRVLVCQH